MSLASSQGALKKRVESIHARKYYCSAKIRLRSGPVKNMNRPFGGMGHCWDAVIGVRQGAVGVIPR